MSRHATLPALGLFAVVVCAQTGATQYRGGGTDVTQTSAPGSIANEQVLIIENDAFGNQRVLSIGGSGRVVMGPQPCVRDRPTENMDCTGADLRDVRWDDARLSSGRFDGADLRGASLRGAELENASFDDASLVKADLSNASMVNGSFRGTSMLQARLDHARLINCDFIDADLSDGSLRAAEVVNTGFTDSNLSRADLQGAQLTNSDFISARLDEAIWVDGRRCPGNAKSVCGR